MQKETKKHVNRLRGFTLVELILVVGTIALVAGALVGLISNSYRDWTLGSNRSTLLQDGQAAMEQMVRILRQAKAVSAVSQSTDQAGSITFTSIDNITEQFKLNAQGELEYGPIGSLSALTGSVGNLVFTCYDINGNVLTGSVSTNTIQSVGIEITLTDGTNSFRLPGRVFRPIDLQSVVINELMYNPSGSNDAPKEWVEVYNSGATAVDLAGWTIWTGSQTTEDTLISHPQFGDGSTTIPAGGYAVITANTTNVYTELVTNGGFEAANITSWLRHSSWTRTTGDAHGGSRKLKSTATGATWVYQNITVPSGFNSYLFLFWEKTTSAVAQTQITATIRNLSNQVLATGYSGQMSSNWACHTMDIAAFAGQTIRIYFSTTNNGSGALLLDDVSVASSYVDINAVRLSVGNDKIGNGLANGGDTVAITNGSTTADSVTYDDTWGGDGDGTSLARIDPQGSSNDQSNWTSGPQNGTPGSAN